MHKLFSLWCSLLRKKAKYIPKTTWLSLKLSLFYPSSSFTKDSEANFPKPSKVLCWRILQLTDIYSINYTCILEPNPAWNNIPVSSGNCGKAFNFQAVIRDSCEHYQGKILSTENCTWKIEIDQFPFKDCNI